MNNICINIGDNWCIIINLFKVFLNFYLLFNYFLKCKYIRISLFWLKDILIYKGVYLYLNRINWKYNI